MTSRITLVFLVGFLLGPRLHAQPAQQPVSNEGAAVWKELRTLRGHRSAIWCVAFSSDGKLLATSTPGYLGPPGEFKIWDLASGRETLSVQAGPSVRWVSFAPDGKSFATAEPAGQGAALVREIATGNVIHTLVGHKSSIDTLAYSADGKWLATASLDKTVIIWDAKTGQELKTLIGHKGPVYPVAFSPVGQRVLSGDATGVAILWDAESGKELQVLSGHSKAVQAVAFSKDNKILATASWDKTVKLWNADTGKEIATLKGHTNAVLNVMFSPDGRTLASSGGQWGDRTKGDVVTTSTEVILWDVVTGTAITTLRGHTDRIFGVAFSPDGNFLATTSFDKTVKIWKGFLPRPSPTPPNSKELAILWEQLADDDVGKASLAVDVLAGAPKQAIPFLGERLLALKPDKTEKHIAALIGQLDDDGFDVRNKAFQELAKLGQAVLPNLKVALDKRPTPEAKQSIEVLLSNMNQTELPKELRRWHWAILALELAGTLEARKTLQEVAKGNAGAWLAQEAHASLKRLEKGAN
jgi:WD40 repeat protein